MPGSSSAQQLKPAERDRDVISGLTQHQFSEVTGDIHRDSLAFSPPARSVGLSIRGELSPHSSSIFWILLK